MWTIRGNSRSNDFELALSGEREPSLEDVSLLALASAMRVASAPVHKPERGRDLLRRAVEEQRSRLTQSGTRVMPRRAAVGAAAVAGAGLMVAGAASGSATFDLVTGATHQLPGLSTSGATSTITVQGAVAAVVEGGDGFEIETANGTVSVKTSSQTEVFLNDTGVPVALTSIDVGSRVTVVGSAAGKESVVNALQIRIVTRSATQAELPDGASPIDTRADVNASAGADANVEPGADGNVGAGASVNVGVGADAGAAVNAGAAVRTDADLSVGAGADVSTRADATVDAGAGATIGSDSDVNVGAGAAVGSDADANVGVGATGGSDDDVDVGAGATVDSGADVNVGAGAIVDADVSADVNASSGVTADVGVDAGVNVDADGAVTAPPGGTADIRTDGDVNLDMGGEVGVSTGDQISEMVAETESEIQVSGSSSLGESGATQPSGHAAATTEVGAGIVDVAGLP